MRIIINYLTAIICCCLFITCKKGDTQIDPTPPIPPASNNNVSLLTSSAIPGELITAQADFPIIKDTATIYVGGTAVYGAKADSDRIVFVLPELPANSTATISFRSLGVNKELSINVGSYQPITQPDEVVNKFLIELDQTIQNYKEYEKSPYIPLDPSYASLMQYAKDNFKIKIAALSPTERKQIAYTLQAYMINSKESKMDTLIPGYFARGASMLSDPEDEFKANVSSFLPKVTFAHRQITAGAAIVAASLYLGPFGIVSGLVGVGTILSGINKMTDAQSSSYNKSVDGVIRRVLGVEAKGQRAAADVTEFEHDVIKEVSFSGNFRTLEKSDASSADPVIKEFFDGKGMLDKAYEAALATFGNLKRVLAGTPPAFPTPARAVKQSAIVRKVAMQAEKLTIQNVSNPAITVNYTREAASLKIKVSSNTVPTNTQFTFDLEYSNKQTGTSITEKINAVFKKKDPSADYVIEIYESQVDFTSINDGKVSITKLKQTLKPGDALSVLHNFTPYIRVKYNGNDVRTETVARLIFQGTSYYGLSITNPTGYRPSSLDTTINNHVLTFFDYTNNRKVQFPVKLTILNTLYRTVVGKTLEITDPQRNNAVFKMVLNQNYTWDEGPAWQKRPYSLQSELWDYFYQDCSKIWVGGVLASKKMIGLVSFDFGRDISCCLPSRVIVFEDGTAIDFIQCYKPMKFN